MKRFKKIMAATLLLLAVAAMTSTMTGCTYGKVCQATKVGNHR
ncbi:MAG: hypothetical protein AAF399_11685 [Bacteroidota bacterium]